MNGITLISALFGVGGLVGAVAAWFKVRPERDSIIVNAAQGAVHIQSGLLDELRDELKRTQQHFQDEIDRLGGKLERVTTERDEALAEAEELRVRVTELESQATRLAAEVEKLKRSAPSG